MGYCFVGWGALLTADWVQAWGSIVGAALGAFLAVWFSVKFAGRAERRAQLLYLETLMIFVGRHLSAARDFLEESDKTKDFGELGDLMNLLEQDLLVFDRMSPFKGASSPQLVAEMIDLTVLLDALVDKIRVVRKLGIPPNSERVPLHNAIVGVTSAGETVKCTIAEEFAQLDPSMRWRRSRGLPASFTT